MDLKEISAKECSCGRVHQVPIKEVLIEENAVNKAPHLLEKVTDFKKIYLVDDKNTKEAAGNELKMTLEEAGFEVVEIMLKEKEGDDHLVPDPDAVFGVLAGVEADGYILACGSGSLNDLTAYAAHKMNKPYSIYATAPSMDGYASSIASITVDGVKKSYDITPPELIIGDLNVLAESPWKLIQSGLGDLLGKVTSLLGWKMQNFLLDPYFCQEAYDLVENVLDDLMDNYESIIERDIEGVDSLTKGLIYSGIAMMMVGNSRPASAGEHQISHFFDMYSGIFKEPVPTHGIKVGVASVITSDLYLRLLEQDFSELELNHDRLAREKAIKEIYLEKAPKILSLLDERWEREKISKERLLDKEAEIKAAIKEYQRNLKQVEGILDDFEFFAREDVKNLNRDWLRKAVNYGFEIRSRYSILTLLSQVGLLAEWGEDAVQKLEAKL
ncbi:sn-glycerol-1-phosphate dehydrogenase [Halanaerobium hydrogeniformans]|uniref:Glycerol-1-phosphate dehydrogenase (NAD(P)(+)) n=1 Tax=Halanaerobium hydrogeniformans TaxID=656519 RepID=E4RMR7_HALHG|nr:sn-glycerol-1-phosphate dehydrogenase [Halanaerobium hydrogeniformans]ADQ14134.1 Glycerol-1-phosphate dehydrogenase (NAD(P)(+)) [Halanaerobium hydrogeniformans]